MKNLKFFACGGPVTKIPYKKAPPFAPTYPSKGGGFLIRGGFLNWNTTDPTLTKLVGRNTKVAKITH